MSRRKIRVVDSRAKSGPLPRRIRIEGVDVLVQPGVSDRVLREQVRAWKAEQSATAATQKTDPASGSEHPEAVASEEVKP